MIFSTITQIDNAISVMGDYEVVNEDPTQIRFKKGNKKIKGGNKC